MTNEQRERLSAISHTLSDAMRERKDCDWSRDTPEIRTAQATLDEAVTGFVVGSGLYRFADPQYVTREEVRRAYKSFADLHRR